MPRLRMSGVKPSCPAYDFATYTNILPLHFTEYG